MGERLLGFALSIVVFGAPGVGVFVTLRPAAMTLHAHGAAAAAPDHTQHAAPAVAHSQHAAPQPPKPASPPAAREAPAPRAPAATEPRLPVTGAERVIDPACAATIDLVNAPRATYQRRVYFFCSVADRDEFVKDPAAYLEERGN
jgi:YHS domain-containing protein